jgi:choice-of-anchor A domain-containing protein
MRTANTIFTVVPFSTLLTLAPTAMAQEPAMTLGEAANYALLGLQNGTVRVDNASTVLGDFGYSRGVTSTDNEEIGRDYFGQWSGKAYVHSEVARFERDWDYRPTGGIVTNPKEDERLDRANADALAHSTWVASLAPTRILGTVDDRSIGLGSIDGQRTVHVIDVTSLKLEKDVLTLTGDAADVFVFNIRRNFEFDESEVRLVGGITANHVLFNLPATGKPTDDVVIRKPKAMRGTVLAPDLGCHKLRLKYQGSFTGAVIGTRIDAHDNFSLEHMPFTGFVCLCQGPPAAVTEDLPSCGSGSDPVLSAMRPVLGELAQLQLASQFPNAPYLLLASLGEPPPIVFPGTTCTIYVDLNQAVTLTLSLTDGSGTGYYGIEVPSSCDYMGLQVALQGSVLDDTVPGPIPAWISNGVRMTVGLQ